MRVWEGERWVGEYCFMLSGGGIDATGPETAYTLMQTNEQKNSEREDGFSIMTETNCKLIYYNSAPVPI